jgi:hypothetical protein
MHCCVKKVDIIVFFTYSQFEGIINIIKPMLCIIYICFCDVPYC